MTGSSAGGAAAGTVLGDANIWTGLIRVSRDFWP
jgi:hypothetical protein